MAFEQIDPGALEGDALRRWYMRSPAEIEQERQRAAAQRYEDFFGDTDGVDSDPALDAGSRAADQGIDRSAGADSEQPKQDADPGFTWVPAGPNRFRSIPASDGQGGPSQRAGDSGVAALFSDGANGPPFDRNMSALASTSADQQAQSGSVLSSYHPTAGPASPRIHVAAHPSQSINVGVRPRQGSPPATYASTGDQAQIVYGALRAPAPSDQELAELRRQQAAFANTARQIDIHNSWLAVPALAPALVALGLGAAGEWATGEVAPEAGQAVANFVERDPYLRVGDNWATRAGRRAHAALKERLAQKPGWRYEPRIEEPGNPPLKPDVGAPQRNPLDPRSRNLMELKPDTPTGRAAAARAVKRYLDATGRTVRPIFYKLEDFI
jgi:hypothetical protein